MEKIIIAIFERLGKNERIILKTTFILSLYIYLINTLFFPNFNSFDIWNKILICLPIALIINLIMFLFLGRALEDDKDLACGVIIFMDTFYTIFLILFCLSCKSTIEGIMYASIIIFLFVITLSSIIMKGKKDNKKEPTSPTDYQ